MDKFSMGYKVYGKTYNYAENTCVYAKMMYNNKQKAA